MQVSFKNGHLKNVFSKRFIAFFAYIYVFVTHITVYMCLKLRLFVVFHNQLQKLSKAQCNKKSWRSGGTIIANLNQIQKPSNTFSKKYLQNFKHFASSHWVLSWRIKKNQVTRSAPGDLKKLQSR